jgi:hypothetical protein
MAIYTTTTVISITATIHVTATTTPILTNYQVSLLQRTCIREVAGSNLSRATDNPDWAVDGFTQRFDANAGMVKLGHDHFLPHFFKIHYSLIVPFDAVYINTQSFFK